MRSVVWDQSCPKKARRLLHMVIAMTALAAKAWTSVVPWSGSREEHRPQVAVAGDRDAPQVGARRHFPGTAVVESRAETTGKLGALRPFR